MRRGLLVAAAVAGLGTLGPAAARAAFPGRNGLLAVAPPSGGGILLIPPAGGSARLVCDQTALCGIPEQLRWSPNGAALTFVDAPSSRIAAIAPDGTCLWCLLGPPLTATRGIEPAFSANGKSVTFTSKGRGGLSRTDLTTGKTARVLAGAVSDAVWSSRGALAIVRSGAVWVRDGGPGKRFRRIAIGTVPNWSPDGTKLTVVRGGWIWIVRVKNRAAHRLARGGAPAWSPDGRLIAYIGPGGTVRTVFARGGRSRSVGVAGRSVDWQPLPRKRTRSCSLPRHWLAVTSTSDAVIAHAGPGQSSDPGWYGCLRALGAWHRLVDDYSGYEEGDSLSYTPELAGRFALIDKVSGGKYGCGRTLSISDTATGSSTALYSNDCGYGALIQGLSSEVLDSSGFVAWRAADEIPSFEPLNAVSCPTTSMCVAVDGVGNVASSTSPAGGRPAWQLGNVVDNAPLGSVSCPTASFCVAAGYADVYASTDPTGPPSTWNAVVADTALSGAFSTSRISCPSLSLCVLADGSGDIVTSTDPSAASSSWTPAHVLSGVGSAFSAIDCRSTSLCVAIDAAGDIVTSTDPTGGSSAWSTTKVDPSAPGTLGSSGISCPSASVCVGVDGTANVLTSTGPAGGGGTWSLGKTAVNGLSAVSCPTASLCVATDNHGDVVTSTDPTGGPGTWSASNVDGTNPITGISCASATACIAVDYLGNVLSSSDPAGGAAAWSRAPVDVPECAVENTACISEHLYVRDDGGSRPVDSTPPGGGNSIANVSLDPNGLLLSWTNGGAPREATLR